jgi:hypothetical protein
MNYFQTTKKKNKFVCIIFICIFAPNNQTHKQMQNLDDIKDVSIQITNKLVELGIIKDCTDTDDETEFIVQDTIREVLCEKLKIEND